MPYSAKTKGLIFILAPIAVLIGTLFLRVIVSLFSVSAEMSDNTSLTIIEAILNFIALICVISMIVLVPLGIIILVKKNDNPKAENELLAGRGERWLAKFLDGLIQFIPAFFVALLLAAGASNGEITDTETSTTVFWLIIISIGVVQAYYLTTQGQTIGKKWLKIRIVDAETHKVGGFVKNVLLRSVLNFVLSLVPLYGLVDVLFIFREDRRCVHDLIAGTIVIRANENHIVKSHVLTGKSGGKFCTTCGMRAKPGAKFCIGCGTQLH